MHSRSSCEKVGIGRFVVVGSLVVALLYDFYLSAAGTRDCFHRYNVRLLAGRGKLDGGALAKVCRSGTNFL